MRIIYYLSLFPSILFSKLVQHELNHDDDRYIVLQIYRLGLANRLRAIADWYLIGSMSNRKLLVSWEATGECNAEFQYLFSSVPENFSILSFTLPHNLSESEYLVSSIAKSSGLSYFNLDYQNDINFFLSEYDVIFSSVNVLFTTYDGLLTLKEMNCQYYMTQRSDFLASLRPNDYVDGVVTRIVDDYFFNKLVIGVHVRMHDPNFDWEVVPPIGERNSGKASSFGTGASLDYFIEVMTDLESNFLWNRSDGSSASSVLFFIASNNQTIKSTLVK